MAEPDLDFREFCRRSKLPQSERSRGPFAAERYRRGETGTPSYQAYNPLRHRQLGLVWRATSLFRTAEEVGEHLPVTGENV